MWNFLDKLRQKNDAQKLMVAIGASALFTFVIVATWIAAITVSDKSEEDQVEAKSEVTPISNISNQVGELKGMFSELVSEFKSTKEVFEELPAMMEEYEDMDTENSTNSTTTIEIESNVE